MQLIECRDQEFGTSEEVYTRWTQLNDKFIQSMGFAMLDLLARLRALPDERVVFLMMTVDPVLCLLTHDGLTAPQLVQLSAASKCCYHVSYLQPDCTAPWSEIYIGGRANSEDEAVQMTLAAMKASKGWSASQAAESSIKTDS